MEPGGSADAVLSTIRSVAETGSTNADMLDWARSGAVEGSWLSAGRQAAGRGRVGRIWASPAGNLYASTLVRLRPIDPAAATLALVAGLSVDEATSTFLRLATSPCRLPSSPQAGEGANQTSAERPATLQLKWPNDLLLDGGKVAGILLERADDAVVIGIGVNLANHPDIADRRTTCLAVHGVDVQPAAFLDTLVEIFARWLSRWRSEGLALIRSQWLQRAHQAGTALTVRSPDGATMDGLFDGLDGDGALILRLAGGERRVIHAADVFLL